MNGRTLRAMRRTGDDRIVTVPNAISLIRLLCVPVFVWLLFGLDRRSDAAWMLGIVSGTDWIDGWIARRFDQGSKLGKIMDPVADRLLLGVGVLAIWIDGSVPVVIGAIVVFREVAISVATVALAAMGARRIDVTWIGKCGTFALMLAFPFFLMGNSGVSWADQALVVGWLAIVPAIALSYWAAFGYVPIAKAALREGRQGRLARNASAKQRAS
jgi:cardiolipin synthase (CMP-forming)